MTNTSLTNPVLAFQALSLVAASPVSPVSFVHQSDEVQATVAELVVLGWLDPVFSPLEVRLTRVGEDVLNRAVCVAAEELVERAVPPLGFGETETHWTSVSERNGLRVRVSVPKSV